MHLPLLLNHTSPRALNMGGGTLLGWNSLAKHLVPLLKSTRASFPQPWLGGCGGLWLGVLSKPGRPPKKNVTWKKNSQTFERSFIK